MKVTDVTLDIVEAQHRPLVVVVVVLVLLIGAATQLVLYHLRGQKNGAGSEVFLIIWIFHIIFIHLTLQLYFL